MTPLERAREVVAGWHDRLIGDIALIIAEAEARGPSAGREILERVTNSLALLIAEVTDPGTEALAALHEARRALADPSPAVKE